MSKKISFGTFAKAGTRWGWYGRGGVGKTTQAIKAALKTKGNVAVVDAEGSIPPLLRRFQETGFDISRLGALPVRDFAELIETLRDGAALKDAGVTAVVVDSLTTIDGWVAKYICEHFRPDPKSGGLVFSETPFDPPMKSRESFGFGKDNVAAYETMDRVLAALDALVAGGIDCHVIMHDCDLVLSDARGDMKMTLPRLQHPVKNPKTSEALRVREWLDNLGYIFRSVETDADGHVTDIGERMVAFAEVGTGVPGMDGTFWAKGRTVTGVHAIPELGAAGK